MNNPRTGGRLAARGFKSAAPSTASLTNAGSTCGLKRLPTLQSPGGRLSDEAEDSVMTRKIQ